jgi:lipopolysaccharide transport system permease protein
MYIKPSSGWQFINLPELWRYRDLLYYLVRRDIKVRYAQSILGVGWALIQPVFYMVVFTIIFGNLIEVDSEGTPYPIFSFVALVPWVYFSTALTESSASLTQNSNMLTKVYVPRLVFPLTAPLGKLIDLLIAMVLVAGMAIWYGIAPTWWAMAIPLLVVLMVLAASGIGMWLAALSVQYRDVKYALAFSIQGLLYVSPVVYPVSLLPDRFRLLYGINPMTGVIEGFRSALLGTTNMPWDLIAVSAASTTLITVTGLYYFRRMERVFSDVV